MKHAHPDQKGIRIVNLKKICIGWYQVEADADVTECLVMGNNKVNYNTLSAVATHLIMHSSSY